MPWKSQVPVSVFLLPWTVWDPLVCFDSAHPEFLLAYLYSSPGKCKESFLPATSMTKSKSNLISSWSANAWNLLLLFAIIWVRSRNCSCLVTWFCYQLIAKPGNKTATVPWPDQYHEYIYSLSFLHTTTLPHRLLFLLKPYLPHTDGHPESRHPRVPHTGLSTCPPHSWKEKCLRACKFSILNNNRLFQSMSKIFCVEFFNLWNSTQNILPIHWVVCSLLIRNPPPTPHKPPFIRTIGFGDYTDLLWWNDINN